MSAVNGWRHQDRARFYAALQADGFALVRDARPVDRLTRGSAEVRIMGDYWRSCRVVVGNRSMDVEIVGGRGWPERLAAACLDRAWTLAAQHRRVDAP